jgi:hypothetical protein
LVAQADQIVVGVRQDASVSFSPDAGFTSDSTLARVVARADWAWNDVRRLPHHGGAVMADPRWKATTNVVVAGTPIEAGATFTAAAEKVADAVARGWVEPAPEKARRSRDPKRDRGHVVVRSGSRGRRRSGGAADPGRTRRHRGPDDRPRTAACARPSACSKPSPYRPTSIPASRLAKSFTSLTRRRGGCRRAAGLGSDVPAGQQLHHRRGTEMSQTAPRRGRCRRSARSDGGAWVSEQIPTPICLQIDRIAATCRRRFGGRSVPGFRPVPAGVSRTCGRVETDSPDGEIHAGNRG